MHACARTHAHIHTHACMHAHTHTRMHTHALTHTHIHTHMHTHGNTHTQLCCIFCELVKQSNSRYIWPIADFVCRYTLIFTSKIPKLLVKANPVILLLILLKTVQQISKTLRLKVLNVEIVINVHVILTINVRKKWLPILGNELVAL